MSRSRVPGHRRPPRPAAGRPAPPARPVGPGGERRPARPAPAARRPAPAPPARRPGHPRRRLVALTLAATVAFTLVVVHVGTLQTVKAATYEQAGRRQRTSTVRLPADRGAILDRLGRPLALSVPRTTFWADPRLFREPGAPQRAAQQLGAVLGLDAAGVEKLAARLTPRTDRAGREVEFTYVARQVDDDVAERIKALGIDGVSSYVEAKRVLPGGAVARGILGETEPDGKGTSGLEAQYDELLAGEPGELVRERDEQGRTIPTGRRELVPPTPGHDLVLTIDRTLQYVTEQQLLQQVAATEAKGGYAVVMDVATGQLLAVASVRRDAVTGTPMVSSANLAVVATYEPGSVAKIVTAAAALEEGVITPQARIQVPYQKTFYDYTFTDAHAHGVDRYDVEDIIAYSSNVGTMLLSQALGPARQEQYLRAFGFGEPTGLGFPGESKGILRPSSTWRGTEKLTVSYGQGVGVTAVQLVAAMNTIANGGVYVAPQLVLASVDEQGVRHEADPPRTRRVLRAETADAMRDVLRAVVCRGTGKRAAVPGYAVAGKTGTSWKAQANGTYLDAQGRRHYVASFAGFVPAERPRFSIVVSIDEPANEARFGGLAAAPLFVQVAQQALRQHQVPPSPDGGACPERDEGGE